MEVIIIILMSACGSLDTLQEQFPDYFVTCMQNERYHLIASQTVDPRLFEYFHVVFVTQDVQSDHLGYSNGSWGWCQPWKLCISHEILHLKEGRCTSDGAHDNDLVYHNGRWTKCGDLRS